MKAFIAYCKGRWGAFGYAFTGAWDLLRNHAPSKIHVLALVGMLGICWGFGFALWKWVAVLICAGMVLAAEAL
ncbi:MAG: diacylglycerol kinase, partial [Bacteroidota bacterium]